MLKNQLTNIIDLFYPLFRRWMPLQTFRYAACGGGNTLLGLFIYSISYKYLFHGHPIHIPFFTMSPHSASLFIAFLINFPLGFVLMKFVVFVDSNIRGRIQLFRYFFVFISNLVLNYALLKLMVDGMHVDAIVSQVIATAIVIAISYLLQRHFTFRVAGQEVVGIAEMEVEVEQPEID